MKIYLTNKFKKELALLSDNLQNKIYNELYKLRDGTKQIIKLTGLKTTGKIRVNDYRVLYEISDDKIYVTQVKDRKEVYRNI